MDIYWINVDKKYIYVKAEMFIVSFLSDPTLHSSSDYSVYILEEHRGSNNYTLNYWL